MTVLMKSPNPALAWTLSAAVNAAPKLTTFFTKEPPVTRLADEKKIPVQEIVENYVFVTAGAW